MARRTTQADLNRLVALISRRTGELHTLDGNIGGYALERYSIHSDGFMGTGVSSVSPRLPAKQLAQWMVAFLDGLETGERTGTSQLEPRQKRFAAEWGLTRAQVAQLIGLASKAGRANERTTYSAANGQTAADFTTIDGHLRQWVAKISGPERRGQDGNFFAARFTVAYTGLYPCLKLLADYTCPIDPGHRYKAGEFVELPYDGE